MPDEFALLARVIREDIVEAMELAHRGLTAPEIAAEIGMSAPSVMPRLEELRVEGQVKRRSRKGRVVWTLIGH